MNNFSDLPMDCLYKILSNSSPRAICRSMAVCSELPRTAAADFVWESFLRHDYHDIVSRVDGLSLTKFRSKKELFFLLCRPLLIDGGAKIFILDINCGIKSYILSAKELSIAWSSDPLCWSWKNDSKSRFVMNNFNELPMDCLYKILSNSSPRTVCRSMAVCSELRRAAAADFVWESFLPHDYHDIVSRVDDLSLTKFGSKKELFFLLCDPLLIDGGTKIFKLDVNCGLKSYILSVKELAIAWSSDPLYWSWKNDPKSRFDVVTELRTTSWLEVHGTINTKCLSPNTTYGVFLIFDISKRAYGLDTIPMETRIQIDNNFVWSNTVHVYNHDERKKLMERLIYNNRTEMLMSRVTKGSDRSGPIRPSSRNDGWIEIELGQFCCQEYDKMVKMSLTEIKGHHLKAGLVIEGIEIRPLQLNILN